MTSKEATAAALQTLLGEYEAPPLSLLERDRGRPGVGDIKGNANIIKRTLANFGIVVELDEISIGPSVTRYAIKPAEGVRLQKIVSLQTNLELALAAHPVRIEAPIPGKSLVGIEVPNSAKVTVGLGTLLESPEFKEGRKPLLVALGRDIAGASHFANVGKMPHALIAGATGSGKSVTIHAIITSLLYRLGPSRLRFIMIDPKRVELTLYNPIPHLLTPVITDAKKAIAALRWAGKEMERRYNILEEHRVRDVDSYHENILAPALERLRKQGGEPEEGEKIPEAMPYIVIVIDELADIMQSYPRELEASIVRLAQMSRAVGIHLLLSTQRPSVNVITGLIKANVPSRVALQVASQIDSRTILDQGGAEKLLGAGDMLYLSGDMGKPVRLQSAFISESEVKKVVDYIAKHNEPELPIEIGGSGGSIESGSSGGGFSGGDDEDIDDDMYEAARAAVIEAGKASTSYIQRKLRVGYARAARLVDMLEERGVIGPGDGAKPREILDKGYAPAQEQEPADAA
jgi:S-DNA-T family DNA segregation ATPase FtsK/SpoIIIE